MPKKIILSAVITSLILTLTVSSSVFAQGTSNISIKTQPAIKCQNVLAQTIDALHKVQSENQTVENKLQFIEQILQVNSSAFQVEYGQAAAKTLEENINTLHSTFGVKINRDWQLYASDLTNLSKIVEEGDCSESNKEGFATQLKKTKQDRLLAHAEVINYISYVRTKTIPFLDNLNSTKTPTP